LQRREFITLLGAAAAWPLTVRAQQVPTIQKVGFLYPGPVTASSARIAAVIEGLRSAGFRVPEQIDLIARIADGDPARLVPLATELIEQKPDVIVTVGSAAVRIVYVLGVTKSRIASGGVINRTAKSIQCADIFGMRRRITQPGCPHFRRIAEGIAAVLTPSGPFFMSTRDNWKQCPLLAQSGHAVLHCKCLLLTQSGHR